MSKAKLIFKCSECDSFENALIKINYIKFKPENPYTITLTFRCQNCDNTFIESFYTFDPHGLKDTNSYLEGCPDPYNYVSIFLDINY